ncbi:cysteine hydrolase family protein [Croceitalea rosinachiae]|uniref:Isochorismatase family protein n=1 Tax=Croceitalea rosinachiae TaxID=3075596 RepID=A0ABU3AF30_9FLAO|nr:isochorismatase family protein [Croceitalea sp. F388]MDT0608147.1 isochorismatase family protein [Croceitalea sp. F388]
MVVDMQKGSFSAKSPRFDTNGVVNRINKLAELFRELNHPVFISKMMELELENLKKNSTDWENLDVLNVGQENIIIDKYANDVFYTSELHSKLKELKVNELFIAGCATDFPVESTIRSALTKDFDITVVKDGHTTGERLYFKTK